jgi:two-component system NtrC family sensor kinase
MPRDVSGTGRKLFFAFALLVLAFGAASYAALRGLTEIHAALHQVKRQETGVRTALSLSSAVRDLYAHQAHSIILGNESHLPLYEAANRRVLALLAEVQPQISGEAARTHLDVMRRASGELDLLFREAIVPALRRGDRSTVLREHGRALELVSLIQHHADGLAEEHERTIGSFEEHAGAVQHASILWTLVLFSAAALFALAFGVYIGRSVALPVARLEAGAARLAAGDLSTRIEEGRQDEFGRLASQFNRMTAALQENQERLVQSERLASIGRLAAGVAHEINNPLGVILGYVRLLQHKAEGPLADDLRIIEEETLRCRDIVEGLLDLSRPQQTAGESVDLREMAEEIFSRLRESAQASGPTLTLEGEGHAIGNPRRLRQILTNLVKNAVEAAGATGHVSVAIHPVNQELALAVRDSGPGLPPEARERLFEPFFTTKPHGTGLGLAVSQAIAQAHGGRIQARTHPEGGAEFTLFLRRST